ncbi:adenylyltransferase/cytidyltransferase family protein [uncultured Acetobacteroides sp.]|uniref:adenylyltransferase/cytidyltransferase family protein n=1 Tax=uncultured Acetobacteroides sp. TaxID=1760811 RepID=UPI0029F5336F|nr:adenylyltransferase/cytidyltransferase family protein [uncultured Acetobacteroides sp.]
MNRFKNVSKKVVDQHELSRRVAVWNLLGKKIVFTDGCFDILHRGHVDYLTQAASKGDVMVIGLHSDASVARLKGEGRPIQNQESRALIVASLSYVDAVIILEEDSPYNLIKFIKPDVLVKGADKLPKDIIGYDIVSAKGGSVIALDIKEGNTERLIDKIKLTQ